MDALRGLLALALVLASQLAGFALAEDGPIPIAELKREEPVDFEKDVLPILAKNCTACHNATKSEASLVLENPQAILKGGDSGPAVVAKNSAESLLLKVASHADEPIMPPEDNNVGAKPLTSEQLGLIKLWIEQGATGEVKGAARPLAWQPLPPGMNPIYAVALSSDGQYAACGRANQIFIYHTASGQLLTRLTDPELVSSGMYENQGVAHLDLVQSLTFSPDGELLASGGYREVKLWRRPQNSRRADLAGATSAIHSIATSADGQWAALGEASGKIQLWDLTANKLARTLDAHAAAVTGLQFVDGARLASASQDKTVKLWNLADGASLAQLETPAAINALVAIAGGKQIATGSADNVIRLYTLPAEAGASLTPGAELAGHTQPITGLAISTVENAPLVSASADGTIRLWNLADGKQLREIAHGAAVTALAARLDGKQIASAGADNLIKLWNAADGKPWASPDKQPIAELRGDFRAQFRVAQVEQSLAFANAKVADDQKALADAEAKIITTANSVTTTQTGKETAAKALSEKQAAVKAPTDAKAAADKELADAQAAAKTATEAAAQAKAAAEKDAANADLAKAAEETKKAAEAADAKVKELEKKVAEAAAALTKATQEATAAEAANSAAEQAAAAAVVAVKKAVNDVPLAEATLKQSQATQAKLQADSEAAKQAQASADKPVRALAYSADGTQLASAGENHLVRTWMSDTGRPIDTFAGHAAAATSVAFAPTGAVLSGAADNAAIVWNALPQWSLERRIGGANDPATFTDRVTALAFSPDGAQLAAGGGEPSRSGELKIFNVADGALVRSLAEAHSDTVFGLRYSPDGKYLASSAADRFVKVFDAATGAQQRSFEGHTHHVLGVAWKWDGKVLASCGADNVIKVWDFTTGDQIRTTPPLGKEVTSIGFVAATPQVLVSSGDKSVRLVNTDNGRTDRNYSGSNDFMYSSATSADGKLGIAGGQDSTLFLWLIENGQLLKSFAAPKAEEANKPVAQAGG